MLYSIFSTGIRVAAVTLAIASLLAFLSAPVFLGMVIITASVVMTVYAYTFIAFIIGAFYKWLKVRKANERSNTYNT